MPSRTPTENAPPLAGDCSPELGRQEFAALRKLIRGLCGISLRPGKEALLRARLSRRLRSLGLRSFSEYLSLLRRDAHLDEVSCLVDAVSTNVTGFFREEEHFRYLRNKLIPRLVAGATSGRDRLRFWSAGCSSGEEPYSIAIQLREGIADLDRWDARILATDLSTRVLEQAVQGIYTGEQALAVAPDLLSRYFTRVNGHPARPRFQVCQDVRTIVRFARLNLMDPWPMRGPFHAIFCRNVMIYFDRPTRDRLVRRFRDLLASGGTLFIGHCESLAGIEHGLRPAGPAIYEKP